MAKTLRLLLVTFIVFGALSTYVESAETAQSQASISFERAVVENEYPNSLAFNILAQSFEGEIVSATLFFKVRDDTSTRRQSIEFDEAESVELTYLWDTSSVTIPPSAPIVYHWEVVDSAGNRASTQEETFYYDDIRFDWQILEDEIIAVWWHDRPNSFGERVYEISRQAFKQQHDLFRVDPEHQIRIIIYNDFDEFAAWHSYVSEFTGGQAFPNIGVTTQIVSAYSSVERWLSDVIPHEISHLYFYQATDHPFAVPPAWLNEGIAQLNEFDRDPMALEFAEREIRDGGLLPLWSLTGSFGYKENDVRLAYAESLSAAVFLEERYGSDGISKLLAAYKSGLSGDEALVQGLGVTIFDLQSEWLEWMGVDPEMYPAPTAEPTLAWPTPPTYPTTVPNPTHTAAPEPVSTPVNIITPSPASSGEETQVIAETGNAESKSGPAPTPGSSQNPSSDNSGQDESGFAICGAVALPLLAAVFIFSGSRKSERP